jgi:hypothetical protein
MQRLEYLHWDVMKQQAATWQPMVKVRQWLQVVLIY